MKTSGVPTARGVSVSRALASSTRAGIFEHLRQVGVGRTVREVAGAFQLHPNVARTHLELLAQAGLVVVGSVKRPGGGRPAKVYLARDEIDAAQAALDAAGQPSIAASALVVRLLVRLLAEGAENGRVPADPAASGIGRRAHDLAVAEGRRLSQGAPGRGESAHPEPPLASAAKAVLRTLRSHAPDIRVLRAGHDWVELAGVRSAVELVDRVDPVLAEAFERGLLTGAFAGAGVTVSLAEATSVPGGARAWRAHAASPGGPRSEASVAASIDTRGQPRETGVVRALRAVTLLGPGEVLEVLASGPGSPAAFARWADRAGHELLSVERSTDLAGRPAIRLLIRKGEQQ